MLYLAKIAAVFISPLGAILALAGAGLVLALLAWRRSGLILVSIAILGLWICAMPITARLAIGALEQRYPAVAVADLPAADLAILLGGAVEAAVPPRQEPNLGEAADRVLLAAELFRAGKVKRILVSGGNLPWMGTGEPEAETIRRLLVFWGVAPDAVVMEGASRTTAENAREVAALWPKLGASSALLVTSGAHMPRALATFRKAGLAVTPAAADIRSVPEPFDLLDLMPDADSLKATSDAVKEVVGYAVYWLRGDL